MHVCTPMWEPMWFPRIKGTGRIIFGWRGKKGKFTQFQSFLNWFHQLFTEEGWERGTSVFSSLCPAHRALTPNCTDLCGGSRLRGQKRQEPNPFHMRPVTKPRRLSTILGKIACRGCQGSTLPDVAVSWPICCRKEHLRPCWLTFSAEEKGNRKDFMQSHTRNTPFCFSKPKGFRVCSSKQ